MVPEESQDTAASQCTADPAPASRNIAGGGGENPCHGLIASLTAVTVPYRPPARTFEGGLPLYVHHGKQQAIISFNKESSARDTISIDSLFMTNMVNLLSLVDQSTIPVSSR